MMDPQNPVNQGCFRTEEVRWGRGGHQHVPSMHTVNCHVERNNNQSGSKLAEDGGTTNKRHGDGEALNLTSQASENLESRLGVD